MWGDEHAQAGWRPGLRLLGVLAAHAVLLALLSPLLLPRAPTRAASPGPAPLWLRWVRPDPVADAPPRPRPSAAAPHGLAAPPRPHNRPARVKPPEPPEPITVAPAADRPQAPTAGAAPQAAAPATARAAGPDPAAAPITEGPRDAALAPAAPAPPTRLNLALPSAPQRAASQPPAAWARQDPRVNTTRPREDRMAQTLGTDLRLRETALNDGARRWQRGTGCLQTRPSRDSQINAQSEAARRQPQLGEPC